MQPDTVKNIADALTDEDLQNIPSQVIDRLALMALAMWPGNFHEQCEEMAWQLDAYRENLPLWRQGSRFKPASYELH